MERKIEVEINGSVMTVSVDEARPSGRPDHETSWQAADVDISLEIDSQTRALASVTIRAGAYLDGTKDDRVWCQAQEGARALVSLLLGEPQPPSEYYAAPAMQAIYPVCDEIGAAIGAAIRAIDTISLYVYGEQTSHAGQVCQPNPDEIDDEVNHWGTGTEEQLLAQAAAELARRNDTRPGGAGDTYRWRCARNVAAWFGRDTVFDDATGRYVIVSDADRQGS